MVLQKQNVPIALGAGVDTKTDRKKVAVGSLLTLENAVIKNSQSFSKRNGYRAIDNRAIGETALGAARATATFQSELLQFNNERLYSYSPNAVRWVDKGPCSSVMAKTESRVSTTLRNGQCDSAESGGHVIYAWIVESTSHVGPVHFSIFDETNGVALLSDIVLTTSVTAKNVRCVALNGYFYVFWAESGSPNYIKVRRIFAAQPIAAEPEVVVTADLYTSAYAVLLYDVIAFGEDIMVTYNFTADAGVQAYWMQADGHSGSRVTRLITGEAVVKNLNIVAGPNSTYYVFYSHLTNLRCIILDSTGAAVAGPVTLSSNFNDGSTADGGMVTGVPTATGVRVFLSVSAHVNPGPYDHIVGVSVSAAGSIGSASVVARSVGLWSKAFVQADASGVDHTYLGVVHASPTQGTYFVVREDGLIVARYQYSFADGAQRVGFCANVWSVQDGQFCFPIVNRRQLLSENGTFHSLDAISKVSIDFTAATAFQSAQLGKNLHIAGGFLSMYDGQSVVEHGFHLYPEIYAIDYGIGAGGISDGTYRYCAVFEWTDNFGQRHRSAPSLPRTMAVSGKSNAASVDVTVNALALTCKRDDRTDVVVSIYRTEDAGDIFYLVTSLSAPTYNTPAAVSLTFNDQTTTNNLLSGEILYTTGGELDNWPAPACTSLCVFKNRLWLAGLENENDVWFSKEHRTDVPVEFASDLYKTVNPTSGGGVRCVFPLDDKLMAFRDANYLYTYGDGPNNTGQGGDFAEFIEVTSDVGCNNPASIVAMPDGLAISTAKGLYKVPSTSLQARYFGAPVAAYNALTITSAVLVEGTNQVRFTTSDGAMLVFDYFEGQWSTFTRLEALGAIVWQQQYALLRQDGRLYLETPGCYQDAGSPVRVRIETGWIPLAGLGGFMRAYQLGILGEYKTPHTMKVSIAHDFEDFYDQEDYFDPEDMLDVTTFGSEATFGGAAAADGRVYGGEGIAYRFRLDLANQKCEAIKILIEETTTAATEGSQEAFTIAALSLYVGVKQGKAKYRQQQTIGD